LKVLPTCFKQKKMTLDAIAKLHMESDYLRKSNSNVESDDAANEEPGDEGQDEESDISLGHYNGQEVTDNDVRDRKEIESELVTVDTPKNLLPINQRSTTRKRQAPCRLSLQNNDCEDGITNKKAKLTTKEQKENVTIAHKAAAARILSLVL
jgi:hypothetical protein